MSVIQGNWSRLPLYGPLDIKDWKSFLEKSKKDFSGRYKSVFHSDTSIKNFDVLATLGRGSFGTVKLVKDNKKENYFATKIQFKTNIRENECAHRVYYEKRILYSIDFPFCVRMEHYCHDNEAVYFLMPFVRGGELYTLMKKYDYFPNNMARFYAAQIVLALEYFQYIHFVYRDLKPENILVDHTGFLKITDFGLTKNVESRTYTICGTPHYMAPEVVQGNGYARSADWWSLGVLIFEMASGRTPFVAKNSIQLFTKIIYAPIPLYNIFTSDLKNLLRGLLNKDVTRRLGNLIGGAEDVKKHRWFKKINWLRLLNRKMPPPHIPETSGPSDTSNFPYVTKISAINRRTTILEESSVRQEVIRPPSRSKRIKKTSSGSMDSNSLLL